MRIGRTQSEIAGELGRSRSTIRRELRRNATRHDGHYRASKAHQYSAARRRREHRGSRFSAEQLGEMETLLKKKWSPEQVSAVLKQKGVFSISHETIYRHVLKDKKAGGRLYTHMRIMSKAVRKRYNGKDSRGVRPANGISANGRRTRKCVFRSVTRKAIPSLEVTSTPAC